MSQLEVSQTKYYSAVLGPMVAGIFTPAAAANFNGSSRIVGLVRSVVGGTVGVPHCSVLGPSAAGANSVWLLGAYSANALDTSTYVCYWYNTYTPSSFLPQQVATAPSQFAP
jgi:hypothetical protein